MSAIIRYLAHAVIHNGKSYRNAIVHIDLAGRVVIMPFMSETYSTVFISGVVAVCAATRVSESHRHALAELCHTARSLDDAVTAITSYLSDNYLYLNQNTTDTPELLMLVR